MQHDASVAPTFMSSLSASAATSSAGPPTRRCRIALLDAFVDAGFEFIDTADVYSRLGAGP